MHRECFLTSFVFSMHFGFGFMHVACTFQLNLEERSSAAQISMVVVHTELCVLSIFNSSRDFNEFFSSGVKFATPHKQQS